MENPRQSELLLLAGVLLGALLATTGLLEQTNTAAGNSAAVVNGEVISKSDYLSYLDLMARDKRNPMTNRDRRHVLDRLIEEKLLIERALEIGLPSADPRVRKTIVNTMIQTAANEADMVEPSDKVITDFYTANLAYFSSPTRISVRRMVFRGDDAASRASAAHEMLENSDWTAVNSQYADQDILTLPSSLLPVSRMNGYLGPAKTEAVAALNPGTYTPPLAEQGGYTILLLQDSQHSGAPPLTEIREQVLREYQRRARDAAVRDYLDLLRSQADVTVDEAFLAQLDETLSR
jgi:hypothetical protein